MLALLQHPVGCQPHRSVWCEGGKCQAGYAAPTSLRRGGWGLDHTQQFQIPQQGWRWQMVICILICLWGREGQIERWRVMASCAHVKLLHHTSLRWSRHTRQVINPRKLNISVAPRYDPHTSTPHIKWQKHLNLHYFKPHRTFLLCIKERDMNWNQAVVKLMTKQNWDSFSGRFSFRVWINHFSIMLCG